MYVIEVGTVCHNCGKEIWEGKPVVVGCEEHDQHVYCGVRCMREAVAVHG